MANDNDAPKEGLTFRLLRAATEIVSRDPHTATLLREAAKRIHHLEVQLELTPQGGTGGE